MTVPCRILLISGSLRLASSNTALLRTAAEVAPPEVTAVLYGGLDGLPHFNPDDDRQPLPPAVDQLRRAIRDADALLFSVPEYAGALPGSFKNLLDWTIGDDQPGSIYEKPVAWLNASPRGAVGAHESLRTVLGYATARLVPEACVAVPVTGAMVNPDGVVADPAARAQVTAAVAALRRAACP